MKIRKLLGGLLLSSVLAAGIGVSVASHISHKTEAVVTKADTTYFPDGFKFYVNKDNVNWMDLHVYYWGDGITATFKPMTQVSGNNYYFVIEESTVSGILINHTDDWTGENCKTANIYPSDFYDSNYGYKNFIRLGYQATPISVSYDFWIDDGYHSEDGLYLSVANSSWNGDGKYYYAYFFNPTDGSSSTAYSKAFKLVPGETDVYETTIPYKGSSTKVYWGKLIIFRMSTETSSPSMSGNNDDQTYDIYLTANTKTFTHISLGDDGWQKKHTALLQANYSDADRAESWGTRFLSTNTCSGSGSILTSDWSKSESEYNQASKTAQGKIYVQQGASTGTKLAEAVYRYDYIVFHKKYTGYGDFIGRSDSPGKSYSYSGGINLEVVSKDFVGSIAIVIISATSLAAIGGYFLFRKKKEN